MQSKQLEKLGVAAEIIKGIEPTNKKDVQGVVMGTSDFNWKASDSTILPGAICDNFTSYGGMMNPKYAANAVLGISTLRSGRH